jgi:phosphoribosyl 1,2-cyclic phosphate phosphodiesterase
MILKRPKVMTFPLTTIREHKYHVDLSQILRYVEKINPEYVVINHMSTECDYNHVNSITPSNVFPAFDGMTMEF